MAVIIFDLSVEIVDNDNFIDDMVFVKMLWYCITSDHSKGSSIKLPAIVIRNKETNAYYVLVEGVLIDITSDTTNVDEVVNNYVINNKEAYIRYFKNL